MYKLEHGQTHTTLVEGAELKLGRAPNNDIVTDTTEASRFHGEIRVESGQVTYRDQESTNGTKINGKPVKAWAVNILSPGDTLAIGDWSAVLSRDASAQVPEKDHLQVERPAFDPSGPQESYQVTGAIKVPSDLKMND